jgi:hypothetical protein
MLKIATTSIAFGCSTYVVITVELMTICYGLGVRYFFQSEQRFMGSIKSPDICCFGAIVAHNTPILNLKVYTISTSS